VTEHVTETLSCPKCKHEWGYLYCPNHGVKLKPAKRTKKDHKAWQGHRETNISFVNLKGNKFQDKELVYYYGINATVTKTPRDFWYNHDIYSKDAACNLLETDPQKEIEWMLNKFDNDVKYLSKYYEVTPEGLTTEWMLI
jgi:hypothetical protein